MTDDEIKLLINAEIRRQVPRAVRENRDVQRSDAEITVRRGRVTQAEPLRVMLDEDDESLGGTGVDWPATNDTGRTLTLDQRVRILHHGESGAFVAWADGIVAAPVVPDAGRGELSYSQMSNTNIASTADTAMTGGVVSVTTDGTRKLRVSALVLVEAGASAGKAIVKLKEGAVSIGGWAYRQMIATGDETIFVRARVAFPSAGTHFYTCTVENQTANTIIGGISTGNTLSHILIDDIGSNV